MEFKDILAISGQPGLFKYIAQSANGIIVESLPDGRRTNASGSSRVSSLAEISMFTDQGELPLHEIMTILYRKTGGKEGVSPKSSPEELKKAFADAVPDYDRDRVHVSDIKKLFSWYNILVGAGMTEFKLPEEPAAEEETVGETE